MIAYAVRVLKIYVLNAYLLLSQTRRQERVTPTAVASLPSAELSWNLFVCWSGLCECVGGSDLVFVCYGSIVCWFVSKSFVCVFTKKYFAVYLYVSCSVFIRFVKLMNYLKNKFHFSRNFSWWIPKENHVINNNIICNVHVHVNVHVEECKIHSYRYKSYFSVQI